MTLSPAFLDELRARIALSPVVARRVKLIRAGREWKGCCPFHNEKTPSFYVNDDKGFYHCFGCGAHGDVIRFLTDQEGLPFLDAVKQLAAQAGMEVPAASPQAEAAAKQAETLHGLLGRAADWFAERLAAAEGAAARAYLDRRGVPADRVKALGLGFAPDGRSALLTRFRDVPPALLADAGLIGRAEDGSVYDRFRGRLMFPIRDARGRIVGFGGRALGEAQPKYLNSADGPLFDKGRLLYNLDVASPVARKSGRLILVEGYMDVIGLGGVGIVEAVAPLGTAVTEAQLELAWSRVDEPILCFDGDAAGQRAALRAGLRALPLLKPGKSLRIATLPAGEDPDDLARRGGAAGVEAVLAAAVPLIDLIWRSETNAIDVTTPERRAAVRQRLRDHAATIADVEVRRHYHAMFGERFDQLYLRRAPPPGQTFVRGHFRSQARSGASAVLKATPPGAPRRAEIGALLTGMLLHPFLLEHYGEAVSALPLGETRERQLRDAILTVVAMHPDLETDALCDHLDRWQLGQFARDLGSADLARRMGYSFTRKTQPKDRVLEDFGFMISTMVSRDWVDMQLSEAMARFSRSFSETDLAMQQQLIAERSMFDTDVMRLAESRRGD